MCDSWHSVLTWNEVAMQIRLTFPCQFQLIKWRLTSFLWIHSDCTSILWISFNSCLDKLVSDIGIALSETWSSAGCAGRKEQECVGKCLVHILLGSSPDVLWGRSSDGACLAAKHTLSCFRRPWAAKTFKVPSKPHIWLCLIGWKIVGWVNSV